MMQEKIFKQKTQNLINQYNKENYLLVIREAKLLLQKVPNNTFLYNLIGSCFQNLNDLDNAKFFFERALTIDNKNISALNNIANVYKNLKNFSLAKDNYQKALNINPNFINALVNYGSLKYELNDYEGSIILYKKALSLNEKTPQAHYNLGLVYQAMGFFDKAKYHLQKLIKINPKMTSADKILSRITKYVNDDPHINEMEKKLNTLELNDLEKINLFFSLGKAYEDLENYEKSFFYLKSGNDLKKKLIKYQKNVDNKNFKTIKEFFKNFDFKNINTNKYNKDIIFIVGMPRSGTSLVEQILSSHSSIYGAGELPYLNNIIDINFLENNNLEINKLKNLNDINLQKSLGDFYFSFMDKYNANNNIITDKAPLNFKWLGLIKLIIPNSKIVHCSRSPKDNCLSLYKNIFDDNLNWCYDEDDLSNFYYEYSNLMSFWKEKLPDFIYDVQYEKLISNPEFEIKNLLNFCDLKWEESCLNFHKNSRAIKTVSSSQARKTFYSSSINSYQKYENFLNKLNSYLDKIR